MTAKQNTIIIVGLLAITAAFLIGRTSKDQNASPQSLSVQTSTAGEHLSAIANSLPSVQRPAETTVYASSNVKAQLLAEYRCQKPSCNMSPFLAENENEALWLRARGYPSPQQRE